MSYVNGYPRRTNVSYGDNYRPGYDTHYGTDDRPGYDTRGYRSYQQPAAPGYDAHYGTDDRSGYDTRGYRSYQQPAAYGSRRHNSYNYHPGSQVAYTNGMSQRVARGGKYYPYQQRSSRHTPNVIVASGSSNLGRQVTPYVSSTNTGYHIQGHRGNPTNPVIVRTGTYLTSDIY